MADELREGVKKATPTAWEAAMLPLSMVLVQLLMAGMMLLSELALNAGMSPFVLVVYRNLIAAAVVTPLALIYESWELLPMHTVIFHEKEGNVEKCELGCVGMDLCKCCLRRRPSSGVVLLRAAGYKRRVLCHLHEPDPHCHLHPCHGAPDRESGAGKVHWQDEAPWCSAVRGWHDGGDPVERPATAPVAYQPAQILPHPGIGGRRSPRHGRGHIVVVRQLSELRPVFRRAGKGCEGIPIKVLDDDADQPCGKRAILCGGRLLHTRHGRMEAQVGHSAPHGRLLGCVRHGSVFRASLMGY